jgi:uncharacterized protein YwqG
MNKLRDQFFKLKITVLGCSDRLNPCLITQTLTETISEQCEQITDDFAVKFAEFLRAKTANTKGGGYKLFSDGEQYTLKELLQHFKINIYGK